MKGFVKGFVKGCHVKSLAPLPLAAALAAAGLPATAQQEEVDRALRDLNIMSNIFSASLEQGIEDAPHLPFRGGHEPEAIYLAGQGMVFSFRTAASWYLPEQLGAFLGEEWGSFYREMQSFVDDITDQDRSAARPFARPRDPSQLAEQTREQQQLQQLRQQAEQMAEQMREQRQHVQDLQRDLRELERDLRLRDGDEGRLAQIEESLDAALARLEEERQAYQSHLEEYEKRRQETLNEYRQGLSLSLATTLCDYGPSLRSLSDDQYISLILEDFGDDTDQVYVFSYADVSNCESPDELLKQAVSYRL